MTFRTRILTSTTLLILTGLIPNPAHAGLLGVGNTVQAFYYNGVFASPEGEIPVAAITSDPASLGSAVDYQQGAGDISTIHVADAQIVITNKATGLPFCLANTPGNSCADVIDGFDFKFTGENILGVSIDSLTAAGFLPVVGTFLSNTHLGLQLISNNEIRVDVTGDLPNFNDPLILNLTFTEADPQETPTDTPEPATLALLGSALAGLAVSRRRRKR